MTVRTDEVPLDAAARVEPDVRFGDVLGQMLSVAVALLGFTVIMSWLAAAAR